MKKLLLPIEDAFFIFDGFPSKFLASERGEEETSVSSTVEKLGKNNDGNE
jgi:hypothetical protein